MAAVAAAVVVVVVAGLVAVQLPAAEPERGGLVVGVMTEAGRLGY